VLTSDLLDDANASTGIGLAVTNAFTGAAGGVGNATADNVWPSEVFDYNWYTDGSSGALQLSVLNSGDTYEIEIAGHATNAARDVDFTIGGDTTRYDSAGGPGVPNAPIVFSGTIVGSTLDITADMVSVFGYVNGFKIKITPAAVSPVITDIDGDDDVFDGQSTTLNGALLGADGGTLAFDGVAQTVASNTDTVANITVIQDDLNYGTHNAIWTDTLSEVSPAFPFTISPAAGLQYTVAADPILNETSLFYNVTPVVVNGDQIEVPTTTDQGKTLTVRPDGTFLIEAAFAERQTFTYRVHSSTDGWTNYGNVTVN